MPAATPDELLLARLIDLVADTRRWDLDPITREQAAHLERAADAAEARDWRACERHLREAGRWGADYLDELRQAAEELADASDEAAHERAVAGYYGGSGARPLDDQLAGGLRAKAGAPR